MKLNFIKASPSENLTAFITNYIHPKHYVRVANHLMTDNYLSAEQVGFIVRPKNDQAVLRLEMSGGEFCGNGLLSAAAYCHNKGLCMDKSFLLEISGSDDLLTCEVIAKSPYSFHAKGEMPDALSIEEVNVTICGEYVRGWVVKLPGISHFITDYWPKVDQYTEILQAVQAKVTDHAIGIIPYKQTKNDKYETRPFVWVKQSNSQVFERSCGSGSLALGILLADQTGKEVFQVNQPGGTINVEISHHNYISTDVLFTCEGIVHVPLD